jgi:SAM-dependent methyltransferase
MRDGETCAALAQARVELKRPLPPPPLGACELPIVRGYCTQITSGMRVLDVGCGAWTFVRDHCRKVGAEYEGIDVLREYFGQPAVATRFEGLQDLSFPDEDFDFVFGNQSMEHWAENGCSLAWGLYQCFRVCRMGGRLCMNVPIHFHGTTDFLLGRIDKLRSLFARFSGDVMFEEWGRPSSPLPALIGNPGYPALWRRPAYVLDIQAVKDRQPPKTERPWFAPGGRLGEFLNSPLSYSTYRLARRLGVVPTGFKSAPPTA